MRDEKRRTAVRKLNRKGKGLHQAVSGRHLVAIGTKSEKKTLQALRIKRYRPSWAELIKTSNEEQDSKGQDIISEFNWNVQ